MTSNKSNQTAEKLRNEGNEFFDSKKPFEALLKYNESLCYSEAGSENIALVYANRSILFMDLKLYEKCQRNIQQAKDAGYPQEKMKTLDDRYEKAGRMMLAESPNGTNHKDPFEFIKLSYPAHPRNPEIVDCLELAENYKLGRHVITNRDLKAGDVVAIEKHFVKVQHFSASPLYQETSAEQVKYQYCAYCLDTNKMDLIPCEGCTTTMYCNEECMQRDFDECHRHMCEIIDKLHGQSNIVHIAIKTFFRAFVICDDSVNKLEKYVAGYLYGNQKSNVFDFDFTEMSDEDTEKAKLLVFLSGNMYDTTKIKQLYISLIVFFQNHSIWKHLTEFQQHFLRLLFQLLYSIIFVNVYIVQQVNSNPEGAEQYTNVGTAFSPFFSLISHSCSPNVAAVSTGEYQIVVVSEPIKRGEQLTFLYEQNFTTTIKEQRQEVLVERFQFLCKCKACVNDFPLWDGLKSNIHLQRFLNEKRFEMMELMKYSHLTPDQAWQKFEEYCDAINKTFMIEHQDEVPTIEIVHMKRLLHTFLDIICDSVIKFPNAKDKWIPYLAY